MIVHLDDLDVVADSIIEPLDHKRLDIEIEYFTKVRASGENIAKYLWNEFVNKIPKPARLYHIRLWETSENFLIIEVNDEKYQFNMGRYIRKN